MQIGGGYTNFGKSTKNYLYVQLLPYFRGSLGIPKGF